MKKQFLEKIQNASLRAKMAVAVGGSAIASTAFPLIAHAAEGNAASDATAAVDVVAAVVGLFNTYPLNIFIGCGVGLAAFRLFKGGKNAAG